MTCPNCGHEGRGRVTSHASDSTPDRTIRYRKCGSCKRNFRTVEEWVPSRGASAVDSNSPDVLRDRTT